MLGDGDREGLNSWFDDNLALRRGARGGGSGGGSARRGPLRGITWLL
jgi:hypothetical protein